MGQTQTRGPHTAARTAVVWQVLTAELRRRADEALTRWFREQNRRFVAPSREQLATLRLSLERASGPAAAWRRELEHLLRAIT